MSTIPEHCKYTKTHEWIDVQDGLTGVCGITDHAQEMLTDIVFVELPEVGTEVKAGEQAAVVESVKAVSDVNAPVSGRIIEVNKQLEDQPDLINSDPYGEGWIFKVDIKYKNECDELMDAAAYSDYAGKGG